MLARDFLTKVTNSSTFLCFLSCYLGKTASFWIEIESDMTNKACETWETCLHVPPHMCNCFLRSGWPHAYVHLQLPWDIYVRPEEPVPPCSIHSFKRFFIWLILYIHKGIKCTSLNVHNQHCKKKQMSIFKIKVISLSLLYFFYHFAFLCLSHSRVFW